MPSPGSINDGGKHCGIAAVMGGAKHGAREGLAVRRRSDNAMQPRVDWQWAFHSNPRNYPPRGMAPHRARGPTHKCTRRPAKVKLDLIFNANLNKLCVETNMHFGLTSTRADILGTAKEICADGCFLAVVGNNARK